MIIPANTQRSTQFALNLWKDWSEYRKQQGEKHALVALHLMIEERLNYWMCKFVMVVRRKDGNEYPPNSLYQIRCGIMRHVKHYCPSINIFYSTSIYRFEEHFGQRNEV